MGHATPEPRTEYPTQLTEIELIEIASALNYHFAQCEGVSDIGVYDMSRATQYEIVCGIVQRMLNRRAGLIP